MIDNDSLPLIRTILIPALLKAVATATIVSVFTRISPFHNIYKGAPPTIIFQGTADKNFLIQESEPFCERMKTYGNTCEVVLYEGREHGFFHYFHGNNPDFISTMETTVLFLSKLGYISQHGQKSLNK